LEGGRKAAMIIKTGINCICRYVGRMYMIMILNMIHHSLLEYIAVLHYWALRHPVLHTNYTI
jgi:hypothetical protein